MAAREKKITELEKELGKMALQTVPKAPWAPPYKPLEPIQMDIEEEKEVVGLNQAAGRQERPLPTTKNVGKKWKNNHNPTTTPTNTI